MFTPSSSRIIRIAWSVVLTVSVSAPTGIASGSITTSAGLIPWSWAAPTIFFAWTQPLLGGRGDPGLIVGEPDHSRVVASDQRQHDLQAVVLSGDRVDQRAALVYRQAGLERLDHGGVDTDRRVDGSLDGSQHRLQQLSLIDQRDSGVDVEHVRARGHLRQRVGLRPRQVAVTKLLRKRLRPVGLIRSPMMQNGCSAPIVTVLVLERSTVSIRRAPFHAAARSVPWPS